MGMKSSATVCARRQNQSDSAQDCESGNHDPHVQRFVQEYDRSDCRDDRHAEFVRLLPASPTSVAMLDTKSHTRARM
jgi:hypothetical protein